MHRRQVLKLFAGFALCPLCGPRSFAADAHWSYEGRDGPAKWGDLDAANRACSIGGEQSPIDIREPITPGEAISAAESLVRFAVEDAVFELPE